MCSNEICYWKKEKRETRVLSVQSVRCLIDNLSSTLVKISSKEIKVKEEVCADEYDAAVSKDFKLF